MFSPREPQVGISECEGQALTGREVLEQFVALAQENPACLNQILLPVDNQAFAFKFDTLDILASANQAKLSQWSGEDEKDFYRRLEEKYRLADFTFSERAGYQDQPDTVFVRNYSFSRTDTAGAGAAAYAGWVRIKVAASGTKFIIVCWEDHKENVSPTFGQLRDELLQ